MQNTKMTLRTLFQALLYFLLGASWALMFLGVLLYMKYFWYLKIFYILLFILPALFLNLLIKYILLYLEKK